MRDSRSGRDRLATNIDRSYKEITILNTLYLEIRDGIVVLEDLPCFLRHYYLTSPTGLGPRINCLNIKINKFEFDDKN